MNLDFGIQGPTFGFTTPLLQEKQEVHHTTVINKFSTPLSTEQADMYMKRDVYTNYLNQKMHCRYYYYDKDDLVRAKFYRNKETGKNTRLTVSHIDKLKKANIQQIRTQDKTILMTEGIEGLEETQGLWKTTEQTTCDKIGMVMTLILCPCFLVWFCCDNGTDMGLKRIKGIPVITLNTTNKATGKPLIRVAYAFV